jgi:hypothetical protein
MPSTTRRLPPWISVTTVPLSRDHLKAVAVRENMMPVILIWGVVGVAWGIHAIRSELVGWE